MVQEQWFLDAVNYTKPIDLFVVIGHNPPRTTVSTSSMAYVFDAIRSIKPNTPIQAFGGHTHIRDFAVYDSMTTGLESGRYCETLGWLSMTGVNSTTYTGNLLPAGVPNPSTPAIKNATATATASAGLAAYTNSTTVTSGPFYARRYLDWNRLTFAYHAEGSQDGTFDTDRGLTVTSDITRTRTQENLTALYGCAPATWCQDCAPFGSEGNIFTLLSTALAATVINESRADTPRLIIINTGSVRFDLVEGPFTYDDSFIVSPFSDGFQYLPDVPYDLASQVLGILVRTYHLIPCEIFSSIH
jgi:2',3'-cyclic-nucleotide 2'-phosphodiesterase (5'-nucleotidase family)